MKRCPCCKELKDIGLFGKDCCRKDGYSSCCKICRSKISSEWNRNHPEQHRFYKQRWIRNNPERNKAIHRRANRKWRMKHLARARAQKREWIKNNLLYERKRTRLYQARYCAELHPNYVKHLICKRTTLASAQIPDSLVKLQTQIIKLKRLCKSLKT